MGTRIEVSGPSATIIGEDERAVTIAVLSDLHFPFEDPDAMRLAHRILSDAKPDVVVLNGDAVDFMGVSRYPVSPKRRARFADEIREDGEKIRKLLAWFPKAKWIYVEGNHEFRLQDYLWRKAGELADLDSLKIPSLLGLPGKVIYLAHVDEPKSRIEFAAPQVKAGKLYILHGDTIKGSGSTINVARTVYMKLVTPALIGHWHRVQSYMQTDYEGVTSGTWVTGCLCRPRPYFDTGRIWGQGVAVVTVENGFFEVELVPFIAKDRFLFAIWRGRRYREEIGLNEW